MTEILWENAERLWTYWHEFFTKVVCLMCQWLFTGRNNRRECIMIFSYSLAVREVIFFNCHGGGSCHVETTSLLCSAQKMKIPIKDLFSKCDQFSSFLWTWSNLLKKSLMENFIFCAVIGWAPSFSLLEIVTQKDC